MDRPREDVRRGWADLHRIRWMGVVLPIAFIIGAEVIRFSVVDTDPSRASGHAVLAIATILGVVAFSLGIFYLIERAQRQVIRQNRQLAAVNAVSTAVQGELGVEVIIDAALESVIASTGATEASVTIFAPESPAESVTGLERHRMASEHASPMPDLGSSLPHLIDIPLSAGSAVVGRMRLHLPAGALEPDLLASSTLQNIGHQLACAIQIGQLVAELNRRKMEGHGLYDVLLRISNQEPLADILAAVVGHARDRLGSDEAVLCLNPATSRSVQLDGTMAGMTPLGDGTVCIAPDPDRFHELHDRQLACPVRSSPGLRTSLEVPVRTPDGLLGELWIGRASEVGYTPRDRGYLITLADLASIAITSARMRESERQAAILTERERIAREMHDSLAQVLGVTHLRLRALASWPAVGDAPPVAKELNDLAELTEEAYRDVREAILGLRESSHVDRGLIDSLRAYLEKYSHQSGVKAHLESTLDVEASFPPRTEVQVIRVIQEALTNVRKHSGAGSAVVRISNGGETVTIVVEDDGRGFDLTGTLLGRDGYGLHTMRERMELIGGTLTIDSAPGAGTRVIASITGMFQPTTPAGLTAAPESRPAPPVGAASASVTDPR